MNTMAVLSVCMCVLQVMSMMYVQSVWMSMKRGRSYVCFPVHMVSAYVIPDPLAIENMDIIRSP